MPELLPKSHRILEKGMMEFRPFGQELTGEKIRDVSGITIRANMEYLQELETQKERQVGSDELTLMLVKLLNERIPDPTFHVTAEFLRNPWNSYSYEFTMFLSEFCVDLSSDPNFHFNLGKEKFPPPIIQILGRPFSIV